MWERPYYWQAFNELINELRRSYEDFFERYDQLPPEFIPSLKPMVKLPEVSEVVGREFEEETLREIEENGMEAIAVYVPYHVTRSWGIYVFLERLAGLAYAIARRLRMDFTNVLICCDSAVLKHEYFHFHTEYVATIIETVIQKATYLPYLQARRPYDLDEEAIANAWMLTSRFRLASHHIKDELAKICSSSPPGYRDYKKYIVGKGMDYEAVRKFWANKFLKTERVLFLPTRLEVSSSSLIRSVIPVYYVKILRTRELPSTLYFIANNWRVEEVVRKLKKVLPNDILEASVMGIRLRTGRVIPVHYHSRESSPILVRIVNEVADNLGIDRKQLRELVFKRDP